MMDLFDLCLAYLMYLVVVFLICETAILSWVSYKEYRNKRREEGKDSQEE